MLALLALALSAADRRRALDAAVKSVSATALSTLAIPLVLSEDRRKSDWYLKYFAFVEGQESSYSRALEPYKAELFSLVGQRQNIVEFGAGGGANARFIAAARPEKYVAVDKNPYFQGMGDVLGSLGDVPTASADLVVGTLVLCSVDDPLVELREIKRILKPRDGRYLFVEHVSDHSLPQRLAKPFQKALADGCDPTRETEQLIRDAGFDIDVLRKAKLPGHFPVGTVIAGIGSPRSLSA